MKYIALLSTNQIFLRASDDKFLLVLWSVSSLHLVFCLTRIEIKLSVFSNQHYHSVYTPKIQYVALNTHGVCTFKTAVDGSKATELAIKKTATVKRWYEHMALHRAFWFRRPKNKLTTF